MNAIDRRAAVNEYRAQRRYAGKPVVDSDKPVIGCRLPTDNINRARLADFYRRRHERFAAQQLGGGVVIGEITSLAGQYAGAGDDYRFSRDYLICAARHALDAEGCSGTSHIILVRAALGCAVIYAPAKDRGTAEEQINPLIAQCDARMKGGH